MSKEQQKFLKETKRKKYLILFLQFFLLFFFLCLWQISSSLGWINSFIFSSPGKVIQTMITLFKEGSLLHHIGITLFETLLSFFLSSLLGILIATILWWWDICAKVLDPYFTVLNSLPKVALGPMILIWFGANMKSIIFMAMLISLIISILNIYQGFKKVDSEKIKLMKTFYAKKWQIWRYLILPSNASTIIATSKLNISMCFIGVIMGEFLVSKEGIGYLIMYGSQVFNLNLVISGIVLLSFLATALYASILLLEKLSIRRRD